jgi:hypothetical protein
MICVPDVRVHMRPPTMHLLDLHYCESIGGVIPRTSPAGRARAASVLSFSSHLPSSKLRTYVAGI